MAAVTPAVSEVYIREGLLRRNVGRIDAIAEQVIRSDIEPRGEDATDSHPLGNIYDIVG
jgi:hypothetical protein